MHRYLSTALAALWAMGGGRNFRWDISKVDGMLRFGDEVSVKKATSSWTVKVGKL